MFLVLSCVNYAVYTQICVTCRAVCVSHKAFKVRRRRRGGFPASLFHSSMERNKMRNRGKAALSSLLCGLQWLTCEECGGLAQELLISPFLGSAKFPQAHAQDLDTVPLSKTLTTSPYLECSWAKPAAHHTLSCVFVCVREKEGGDVERVKWGDKIP